MSLNKKFNIININIMKLFRRKNKVSKAVKEIETNFKNGHFHECLNVDKMSEKEVLKVEKDCLKKGIDVSIDWEKGIKSHSITIFNKKKKK